MQIEQLFERAAQQFENNNYEAGLTFITHCINQQPYNSSLYSNRALCFAQLGDIGAAQKDLNKSIELNHLNYVSYFNLFSLQYRAGQLEEALGNLCCSLSCLYLLSAKKSRRELDVQRSISYADNNFQAFVLKSLMYLEEGRLKQALNYIEWALDINPNNSISKKLKNVIQKKIDPYFPIDVNGEQNKYDLSLRLKSSYKAGDNFEHQFKIKLNQFNEIYQNLIGKQGRISQKLPRNMVLNDKTIHKSYFLSEINDILETKNRQKILNAFYGQSVKKSQAITTKQQLLQQRQQPQQRQKNEEDNLLDMDQQDPSMQDIIELNEADNMVDHLEQNLLDNQEYIVRFDKDDLIATLTQKKEIEQQENLLEQNYQKPKHEVQNQRNDQKKHQSLNPSKKQTVSNSKVSEISSTSQSVNLYPIGKKKKLQFTIIGAELKTPGNHKDFYLTGKYNSRKGQRIRTNIKKLEGNSCKWYNCNPPTTISQNKQTLEVKLYSKQYFSVNDELIGEGEIEVIRSGQTKIPIYYKAKMTGFVSVRIDLV